MKKFFLQLILIAAIGGAAVWGGKQILNTEPAKPKGEEHEHAKGEEHEHEHGKEGHVELSEAKRKAASLKIEEAGRARIKTLLSLYGKVAANEEAIMHVHPRFPGLVKEVHKRLGDPVKKGEVLGVVESNDSLRPYEIKSEIDGTVIEKDMTLGEAVKDDNTLFTVADMTSVWVDLAVFRQDFYKLKAGQPVAIHIGSGPEVIETKVSYISPFGTEGTQSMLARCIVPNTREDLKPGLFVTAEIATAEIQAPVAVRLAAIQTLKEKTVVFIEEGDAFEAREVALGARDNEHVEVLSGLAAGDKYVSDNSFILKAEIGKEEAGHED